MSSINDTNDLRLLIRKVLHELLPTVLEANGAGERPGTRPPVFDVVSIKDDADLEAFVRRLVNLAEDPVALAELRTGRRRFRLAGGGTNPGPASSPRGGSSERSGLGGTEPDRHQPSHSGSRGQATAGSGGSSGSFAAESARNSGHGPDSPPVSGGARSAERERRDSAQSRAVGDAHREYIADGVVSEAQVAKLAKGGKSLLLGRKAVITPLARDRAKQLGLDIEKEA